MKIIEHIKRWHPADLRMGYALFCAASVLSLSSCFQEDEPVPPYASPGDVTTVVAEMGSDYAVQLFYDLGTNQFVKIVPRESWDLAFETGDNDFHVYLNSSKKMAAWNTGQTDFATVTADAGAEWRYDVSDGNPLLTAIGDWGTISQDSVISLQQVYVIDRGLSTAGNSLGKIKFRITGMNHSFFKVEFSALNGSNYQTIEIPKDEAYNFTHLSFTGPNHIVSVEPLKEQWDLLFTQYTTVVFNADSTIMEHYLVNGVLLNTHLVTAATEFSKPFSEILYSSLASYTFSNKRDMIGYDWKVFNFNTQTYQVNADKNFLVKDHTGDYYKLRFISFTNDQGQKGYPKLETAKF